MMIPPIHILCYREGYSKGFATVPMKPMCATIFAPLSVDDQGIISLYETNPMLCANACARVICLFFKSQNKILSDLVAIQA